MTFRSGRTRAAAPFQFSTETFLRAGDKTDAEIAAVEAELETLAVAEAMLQPA